jgi:hypothetical protein
MPRFDLDPELLRRIAEAGVHAADEALIHMEAEFAGNIPELMKTLVDEGPYAYTIIPQVDAEGNIKMPLAKTWDEVNECYKFVRGRSDLLSAESVVEIRGAWYSFQESLVRGHPKGSDVIGENITYALFPCATGKGITGELVWREIPRDTFGAPGPGSEIADGMPLRRHMLALHDRYINALRAADVEGILEVMNDAVQAAVRDYVNDTGTLTNMDRKEGHADYYRALFAKYDVVSVDLLDRVVQNGYVFAELRFTMRHRNGAMAGKTVAFHTAEFFVPGRDSRFTVRIGHGTEPA